MQRGLSEQVQRARCPELQARAAAELEPGLRALTSVGRVASQRKLGPADEGRPKHPVRQGRVIPVKERVRPGRALGEGALDDPDRPHRHADPQPGFRVAIVEAPGQNLAQVGGFRLEPPEGLHPLRPRPGQKRHADQRGVLHLAHRVVAEPGPLLVRLSCLIQPLRRVGADRVEHPVPDPAVSIRLSDHERPVCQPGKQVQDVAGGQLIVRPQASTGFLGHLKWPAGEDGQPP